MRLVLIGTALALLASCSRSAPLAHTLDSPEAVASAVLDAYALGNRDRLMDLALSEQEFADHVWPDLPAARPERNLPLAYVWGDLNQKSQASLSVLLAGHRGRRYTLLSHRFKGRTAYASYTVHREAVFVVRDVDGLERELRLCGSMIEQDGRWKVFSYVVDN